jgi:hypothetical protein
VGVILELRKEFLQIVVHAHPESFGQREGSLPGRCRSTHLLFQLRFLIRREAQ